MWVTISSSVKGSPAAVDDVSPAVVGVVGAILDAAKHEIPAKVESPADTSCPIFWDQDSVWVVLRQANLGLPAKDGTPL